MKFGRQMHHMKEKSLSLYKGHCGLEDHFDSPFYPVVSLFLYLSLSLFSHSIFPAGLVLLSSVLNVAY